MKKLFAIMLALMLVLTMGSALAEGDGTAPTPEYLFNGGTFKIAKTYNIDNEGTTPPTETLKLSVEELGGAPALERVAYDKDSKKFIVDLPMYTNVGEYIYEITEAVDNPAGGVTYDTNTYYLKVTVAYEDDTYTNLVCYPALHTGSVDGNKADAITNTYEAGSLSISKAVTGNMGDKSKYFEFTVTLTGGEEGKTYPQEYTVTSTTSNGNNPTTIELGKPATVYLRDGETFTIENLPKGMTYKVVEAEAENYTTTIDGASSTDRTANGEIANADVTVKYVNDYDNGTIDTGITTDNLPYIVLMGIVVLAGVAMIAKRRMAHND